MTNREIGVIWMADVLARLYEAWPVRVELELQDIMDSTGVDPTGDDNDDPPNIWDDLGFWLEAEGIIRRQGSTDEGLWLNVTLTGRGFEALGRPAPGTEKSIGTKMKDMTKTVGKEAAVAGAKTAASEAIKATEVAETVGVFLGGLFRGASGSGS